MIRIVNLHTGDTLAIVKEGELKQWLEEKNAIRKRFKLGPIEEHILTRPEGI